MSFTLRPHCRYRPRKPRMVARITIAVGNGMVRFYPEGQPQRVIEQTEGDFRTWAEVAGVSRGVVLRDIPA